MSDYPGGFTYRPIDNWPGERTPRGRRRLSPFRGPAGITSWSQTSELLHRELRALSAREIILQVDMPESMIRLDGMPRSNATAASPAVILSFGSKHGPLRYACDLFTSWKDNVRAIALGLEALRKVERYGITRRGEQYTGFARLPPGTGISSAVRGQAAYRIAARNLHPDMGGNRASWDRLQTAMEVLREHWTAAGVA